MAPQKTAYLVFDCESVPDGKLIRETKYAGNHLLTEAGAISAARVEAIAKHGNEFLPVTYQYPVAVCGARVNADLTLHSLICFDDPAYRPEAITGAFWREVADHRAALVSFNGRGFDLPLLELAAFRFGHSCSGNYFANRGRFNGISIDLADWLSNFGACRLAGGLNLLAKLIGRPGKFDVSGDQVEKMHREGKSREIVDYCLCDVLDTYFVFLRTRVMTGQIDLDQEAVIVAKAEASLRSWRFTIPILGRYLEESKRRAA